MPCKIKELNDPTLTIQLFEMRIFKTYREMSETLKKENKLNISYQVIFNFFAKHKEEYEAFRKEWFDRVKEEDIANARCRIRELYAMATKLKEKIEIILKRFEDTDWAFDRSRLTSLLREYRLFIDQIGIESGDRVSGNPNEFAQRQAQANIVFGDVIVNNYADKVIEERGKESVDPRNRFEEIGLSDLGNSVSGN